MTFGQLNTEQGGVKNNAIMPTAAPIVRVNNPQRNDQSLGRNNTGTGNRYRPTSCPEFKFRNWSKHFCIVLLSSKMPKLRIRCLNVTLLWIQRKSCVGIVCMHTEGNKGSWHAKHCMPSTHTVHTDNKIKTKP